MKQSYFLLAASMLSAMAASAASYEAVTNVADITTGEYVIVNEARQAVMSSTLSKSGSGADTAYYFESLNAVFGDKRIETVPTGSAIINIIVEDGKYYLMVNGQYITSDDVDGEPAEGDTPATYVHRHIALTATPTASSLEFTEDGNVVIYPGNGPFAIAFNSSNPRFTTYYTKQQPVQLYKNVEYGMPDAELAWSASAFTYYINGGTQEFPTLSNPNGLNVHYSSSVPEVATIDANGKVTIAAEGTTVITAQTYTSENEAFASASVSYTLEVVNPLVITYTDLLSADVLGTIGTSYADVNYTADGKSGKFVPADTDYNFNNKSGISYKLFVSKNSGALRFNNSGRQCGLAVADNPKGYTLQSMTINWQSNDKSVATTIYGAEAAYAAISDLYDAVKQGTALDTHTMTPAEIASESNYTFIPSGEYSYVGFALDPKSKNQILIKSFTFVWTENRATAPIITIEESDGYDDSGDMTKIYRYARLTVAADAQAEIYYTLDGTNPEVGQGTTAKYAGEIIVTEPCTVKAIAVINGQASDVASCTITRISVPAPEVTITPDREYAHNGYFEESATVTFATTLADASIIYTLDGSDPEEGADGTMTYAGTPVKITSTTTVRACTVKHGVSSAVTRADIQQFVQPEGMQYTPVNAPEKLIVGQAYIIAARHANGTHYAMQVEPSANNIKGIPASYNNIDGCIYLVGDDHNHSEFILDGNETDGFYFWRRLDSDKSVLYLVSLSGTANQLTLKSGASLSDALVDISFNQSYKPFFDASTDGEASVVFRATDTKNNLYMNENNGGDAPIFCAYDPLTSSNYHTLRLFTSKDRQMSGVEHIAVDAADDNAPVEYYNLQGIRIAEPAAGTICIRRAGATATKVIIK